jgi:RimJ/RimL family protein N-acetyltransferase
MRNPILTGERVYLRALEKGDSHHLARLDAVETDTFMWRGRTPTSPIEQERWIAELYRAQPPVNLWFAVCAKDEDTLIGVVGVLGLDWVHRTGETASWLGPADVRGQGFGTEAKHLLLEYCFDRLHLHVLLSIVDEPNTRSAAALGKQGYRPAGRRRWSGVKDGRYVDAFMFDVKREEWLAARDAWRASRLAGRSAGH